MPSGRVAKCDLKSPGETSHKWYATSKVALQVPQREENHTDFEEKHVKSGHVETLAGRILWSDKTQGEVPQEQKMLKGHPPRVIYH